MKICICIYINVYVKSLGNNGSSAQGFWVIFIRSFIHSRIHSFQIFIGFYSMPGIMLGPGTSKIVLNWVLCQGTECWILESRLKGLGWSVEKSHGDSVAFVL